MMKKLLQKVQFFTGKMQLSGVIIALLSFILIGILSFLEVYDTFEMRLYDVRFGLKPSVPEWDQLVFLDIDDIVINNIGEYPWARRINAGALSTLKEVGARQVTFDMEFPNPSPDHVNRTYLNSLKDKAKSNLNITGEELDNIVINNDLIFAQGISGFGDVILPYHFPKDVIKYYDLSDSYKKELIIAKERFKRTASVPVPEERKDEFSAMINPELVDIAIPIPELAKAAKNFGYTDSEFDSDGVLRKNNLIRVFNGRIYFQMALVMLMDICQVEKENVEINPGKNIILKDAVHPVSFEKKDIKIPIDEKGRLYINWAGTGVYRDSFIHIPFDSLLEYQLVKDEIFDFFDEQEIAKGTNERSRLYGELSKAYETYNSENSGKVKYDSWQKISEIRKQITGIEKEYISVIRNDIKNIERELKKAKDPELEIILGQLKNYLKGANIVIEVESLRDKICIAGLVAAGTQDIGAIPTNNEYWMVGTYPNIINTVVNNAYIFRVNKILNLIIMFVLALGMGIFINRLGARISLIIIVAALVLINFLNIGLFAFFNIWIEQLGTNLAVFLPSVIIASIKLLKEESQKRYIKNAFSRYLAPGVIERIIESPEALELGGEEREITIFFSDVAKFSTISEKLTPPKLVSLLNEYLSEMTDIILEYGGTVDKYEGDAIMAFFGAPHPFQDHALRCCYASIDMKKRLREMQDNWRMLGTDVLQVRMGMNTGKAVVGNMGSRTRMDYTAMGDSVNLASRLEGVNKFYNTYAMMSETTYEYVKDSIEVRKLDIVRVVGKQEPIIIYELLGKKGQLPDRMYKMMEKYYKALDHFANREWKKAIAHFEKGLEIVDDDGPSQIYIERCEQYLKRPPSKKWDGVYKLTSK